MNHQSVWLSSEVWCLVFSVQVRALELFKIFKFSERTVRRILLFYCLYSVGADLKERALMNNTETDLFVHGLRSLMTQIGRDSDLRAVADVILLDAAVIPFPSVVMSWQLYCRCHPLQRWTAWPWEVAWSWPWPVISVLLVSDF